MEGTTTIYDIDVWMPQLLLGVCVTEYTKIRKALNDNWNDKDLERARKLGNRIQDWNTVSDIINYYGEGTKPIRIVSLKTLCLFNIQQLYGSARVAEWIEKPETSEKDIISVVWREMARDYRMPTMGWLQPHRRGFTVHPYHPRNGSAWHCGRCGAPFTKETVGTCQCRRH